MPAVAGAGVLAVVIIAGVSGSGGASSADTVAPTVIAAGGETTTSITTLPIVVNTDPAIVKTSISQTIGKGNAGEDVKQVQQRLTDLGFAPGPIDGVFGSGTQQAVWAYEKLILKTPRADAKGRVSNDMWQEMQDHITIPPRRPTGAGSTHVEIYVPEEVLIVFKDDAPQLIAHISTGEQNPDGTPKKWCDTLTYDTGPNGEPLTEPVTKQECADAKTPGGVFRFTRRYEGKRTRPIGRDDEPGLLQLRDRRARRRQRAAGAGVARMRAPQSDDRQDVPVDGGQRRPGLRVGPGRQAARAVQPARKPAVVQLRRPRCDHHDRVDHHHGCQDDAAAADHGEADDDHLRQRPRRRRPPRPSRPAPRTSTSALFG